MKSTGRSCPVTNIEDFEEEKERLCNTILDKLKKITTGFNNEEKVEIYKHVSSIIHSKIKIKQVVED